VGNDPVVQFDTLGLEPGKEYIIKEEAIFNAIQDVLQATNTSVADGLKDYSPDYSPKILGKLIYLDQARVLAHGANYISIYLPVFKEIRSIYGVEYGTFVSCDPISGLFSYGELMRGELPTSHQMDFDGVQGQSGPTGEAAWEFASASAFAWIHSHNILVVSRTLIDGRETRSKASRLLSDYDKTVRDKYDIDIIAVGDENDARNFNFVHPEEFDFIPIVKPGELPPK
jgi:hypothetical protein